MASATPPEAYRVRPSVAQANPRKAPGWEISCLTVPVRRSRIWIPCCRHPPRDRTNARPSGEAVAERGMFPTGVERPAGSRRTPVGSRCSAEGSAEPALGVGTVAAVPHAPSASVHPVHAGAAPKRDLRCIPMLTHFVVGSLSSPLQAAPSQRNRLEETSWRAPSWLSVVRQPALILTRGANGAR